MLKAAGLTGAFVAGGTGITSANGGGEKSENHEIHELREATAKYHDLDKALDDGYILPDDHCVSHPDPEVGAMGYHYIKPSIIDDTVSSTDPEVLVYEQRGNERHLVAVEFLSTAEDPPTLFGHEFHEFDQPQANWELHVWAWKDNPSGLFADFNPRVECPD